MRRRFFPLVAALLLILPLPVSAGEKIIIEGTGDSQDILRLLAARYEKTHPGSEIEVPDSIGSSGGIKLVSEGKCDLARVARPLKAKEEAQGLSWRLLAHSPVVFAARLESGCPDTLTTAQVLDIYRGSITSWPQIGTCQQSKLFVAYREEGDSCRSTLEKKLPGFKDISAPAGKQVNSTPELVDILTNTPGVIGYAALASVQGKGLTVFALDGTSPLAGQTANPAYPVTVPFALVSKGEPRGLAADFLAFLASPEGRSLLTDNGLVPPAQAK